MMTSKIILAIDCGGVPDFNFTMICVLKVWGASIKMVDKISKLIEEVMGKFAPLLDCLLGKNFMIVMPGLWILRSKNLAKILIVIFCAGYNTKFHRGRMV